MTNTKKIISIAIVFQWVIATSTILMLIIGKVIEVDKGLDLLKSYSAITSGFVGIVIGHLFSSNQ